jgi:hypothetical protein
MLHPFFIHSKSKKMTTTELKTRIDSFRGGSDIHLFGYIGNTQLYLTDGCQFVLEYCKADWLFDIILNHWQQAQPHYATFYYWYLKRQPNGLFRLWAQSFFKELYFEQDDIDEQFPLDEFCVFNSWQVVRVPMEVYA